MKPLYGHSGSWINEKKHIFNGSGIDENIIKCKIGYRETSIGY